MISSHSHVVSLVVLCKLLCSQWWINCVIFFYHCCCSKLRLLLSSVVSLFIHLLVYIWTLFIWIISIYIFTKATIFFCIDMLPVYFWCLINDLYVVTYESVFLSYLNLPVCFSHHKVLVLCFIFKATCLPLLLRKLPVCFHLFKLCESIWFDQLRSFFHIESYQSIFIVFQVYQSILYN